MKIFITGISSGIGRALCRELVASGHAVWGVARREELLQGLARELESDNFIYGVCDISDEKAVEREVAEMIKSGFIPDVVVLNAAIEKKDVINGYEVEVAHELFSVNYFGALKWVELFLKKFTERGKGHFIAISSIFAKRPDVDSASYCSSKSALSMAFRSLYLRYLNDGIAFTNIYFGPVDTDISSSYSKEHTNTTKPFFIISPETAANCILKAINGRRPNYYFPFFVTLPVRLTLLLSDNIFYKLTKCFRR